MTNDEINAAIAEACGWNVQLSSLQYGLDVVRDGVRKPLPDYCNDLNAMHEAEDVLKHADRMQMSASLITVLSNEPRYRPIWHATARQRAEAFLRALGKWEEVAQ